MPSGPPNNFTGTDTSQTIQGSLAVLDDGSGSFGQVTVQGVNAMNGDPTPMDLGMTAWTFDATGVTGTKLTTGGTVYLSAFWIRANTPVSKLAGKLQHTVTTAGATLTAAQNFVGVYTAQALLDGTATGARIGVSADQSGVWTTAGTYQPALTWYSNGAILIPGQYWAAVITNGTTQPTFRVSGGDIPAINGNLATAFLRAAVNGTGATSLAASVTPSSNSAANAAYFYAALF